MNLLALTTARIGRRRKITQQDMAALLADFAMAGLDTTNDCVEDAAPQAWAKLCKGLTCISVSAPPSDHGQPARWHGSIRFDTPGDMGLHHATLIFAPAALGNLDYDQLGQLRKRCARLILVSSSSSSERTNNAR